MTHRVRMEGNVLHLATAFVLLDGVQQDVTEVLIYIYKLHRNYCSPIFFQQNWT